MSTVGKIENPRASKSERVRKTTDPAAASTKAPPPQRVETAAYIADMCGELRIMAKNADLPFLAQLLAMAQAEAHHAAD